MKRVVKIGDVSGLEVVGPGVMPVDIGRGDDVGRKRPRDIEREVEYRRRFLLREEPRHFLNPYFDFKASLLHKFYRFSSIDLKSKGNSVLTKFLNRFKINGFIDSFQLRGYRMDRDGRGVCTFGIRLRGYTGGNIDLEVPLAFDAESGEMLEPVVAFLDGKVTLIGQSLFDDIFDRLNLERKLVPGWMSLDYSPLEVTTFRVNDKNKYRVGSISSDDPDLREAFEGFYLCLCAGRDNLLRALERRAYDLSNTNLNRDTISLILYNNFLGSLPKGDLDWVISRIFSNRLAQGEDKSSDEVIPPVSTQSPSPGEELSSTSSPEGVEAVEEVLPSVYSPVVRVTPSDLINIIKILHILRFIYQTLAGEVGERVVEPHYIWMTNNGKTILIAWDTGRNNWRSFDLSRMKDLGVMHDGRWVELGQFNAFLEDLRRRYPSPQEAEAYLVTKDSFIPRGPYSTAIQYTRPGIYTFSYRKAMIDELDLMKGLFFTVLRDKIDYLSNILYQGVFING